MHKDMHFYGTYAVARAAGIPSQDAYIIAYSSQFVDDSTEKNGDVGKDGSMMFGIATAHHHGQSIRGALRKIFYNTWKNSRAAVMQRQIWVPFHFLPGGQGSTLEEKMICGMDSQIAQDMIEHHIQIAWKNKLYGLYSLGVAAHVYMDTFAHYGFAGEGSEMNNIENDSIRFEPCKNPESDNFLETDHLGFTNNKRSERVFNLFASKSAEMVSGNLGHAAVSTYPDRPYLKWSFEFSEERHSTDRVSVRNNQETYMQGCKRLHDYFTKFCNAQYRETYQGKSFDAVVDKVKDILSFEDGKNERSEKWLEALHEGTFCTPDDTDKNLTYDSNTWEKERRDLRNLNTSEMINTNIYKFHQAATLHRWFIFKDLLPQHGICLL